MNAQLRQTIMEAGQNITINVNAAELRELVFEMVNAERRRIEQAIERSQQLPTLTRRQAAEMLDVTGPTLIRWEREGYLIPSRIGRRVYYRQADIDQILLNR